MKNWVKPGNARPWLKIQNRHSEEEPEGRTIRPVFMPSPSQAVRVGTPISWWATDSPPIVIVSKPTGPDKNSPTTR
jgi:hypothetical protein